MLSSLLVVGVIDVGLCGDHSSLAFVVVVGDAVQLISKPALPWTALASDPGIPATPNKVPNWLSLSSLLQVSPAQPSLGKCLLVVTF